MCDKKEGVELIQAYVNLGLRKFSETELLHSWETVCTRAVQKVSDYIFSRGK